MPIKTVDQQSPEERRDHFHALMDRVVLPQRERLLQARDHTWQSAYVDDDGYLAELIAALVIGKPGTSRKGVSRTTGDLGDGTEVKKGYRVDPNIDFVLDGTVGRDGNAWFLQIPVLPAELHLPDICDQLNSNACSVQRLDAHGSSHLGSALWRTTSKDALRIVGRGGRLFFAREQGARPSTIGEKIVVCLRQERGHINFGDKTRAQLEEILVSNPVLVFYQHDLRGRFSVAVLRVQMSAAERRTYLDEVYANNSAKRQVQPYLFPDNVRTKLYPSGNHSVAHGLRGRLLAYGVHGSGGFDVLHWNVKDPPLVGDVEALLTGSAIPAACPNFRHRSTSLAWTDTRARRDFAGSFFDECVVGYNRALQPYCSMTGSTRNIGLGNLAQHLAGIATGLRGTRSGARGADLVEPDGVTPSEIKLATGQRGDTMGTEDMPRLTLGWGHDKMLGWKRLIAVRMVELNAGKGPRWHAMVHAPSKATMLQFRAQVKRYFEVGSDGRARRVNNGSGGLQYHATAYPHDGYGTVDHTLDFVRVADFQEGRPAVFPSDVPEW